MVQFEGEDGFYDPEEHGFILVLEEGDELRGVPVVGESCASARIDDDWQPPFEYVFFVRENGRRIFEAAVSLAGDAMLILIVPEEPWVDARLMMILDAEGQEETT